MNLAFNNGVKNKTRKQIKAISRKVLKGGRVKDVVLEGVPDELYKEGKKCNYDGEKDGLRELFSKDITDPKIFYDNLDCICPLYRFHDFVNERLNNKNFVLRDTKKEIMLYNFSEDKDTLLCLEFEINDIFTVLYKGIL